eukprot:GFYU01006023.1.p1 GENE.GFYU01006023.1~~GFYU01006023.1.p1  ORF type:complete len:550 (-),score=195.81 GFYU01006023.1:138-1787(-)
MKVVSVLLVVLGICAVAVTAAQIHRDEHEHLAGEVELADVYPEVLLEAEASPTEAAPKAKSKAKNQVILNAAVNVKGTLTVGTITSPNPKLEILNSVVVPEGDVKLKNLNAAVMRVEKKLSTNALVSESGNITLSGDMTVPGYVRTARIISPSETLNIAAKVVVDNEISSKSMKCENIDAGTLVSNMVTAPSGALKVTKNLAVQKSITVASIKSPTNNVAFDSSVVTSDKTTVPKVTTATISPTLNGDGIIGVQGNMTFHNGTIRTGKISSKEGLVILAHEVVHKGAFKVNTVYTSTLQSPSNNVTVIGDLVMSGTNKISTRFLSASSGTIDVQAGLQITGQVKGDKFSALSAFTSFLQVDNFASTGPAKAMSVNSHLKSSQRIQAASLHGDHLHIDDVKQWQLVAFDSFDETHSAKSGWSPEPQFSTCGNPRDHFMSGSPQSKFEKMFENLPPHSQLKMTARYHFIDQWDGEVAFAQLNGETQWMEPLKSKAHGLNVCGSQYPESKLSAPVEAVIPHSENSVRVGFGSTLPAEANGAWGVDDVMVYVR